MYRTPRSTSATTSPPNRHLARWVVAPVLLSTLTVPVAGATVAHVTAEVPALVAELTCQVHGSVRFDPPIAKPDPLNPEPEINVTGNGTLTECVDITHPLWGMFSGTWEITSATMHGNCAGAHASGEAKLTWNGGPGGVSWARAEGKAMLADHTVTGTAEVTDGPYEGYELSAVPLPILEATTIQIATQCVEGKRTVAELSGSGTGFASRQIP